MLDLIERSATLPSARLADDLAAADFFVARSKSQATQRAYRSDFRAFAGWCAERNVAPLPASPDTVRCYAAALAVSGLKASSITRRIHAIRFAHKAAGFDVLPTAAESVRATMAGIRRELGTAPARKAAVTDRLLRRMLAECPADTALGLRNRALLSIGFFAALRRSELVALNVEDIIREEAGIRIVVRRSKTDQEGEGREIAVLTGTRLKPVAALDAWLAHAGITTGPIFRAVAKGGRIQPGRMQGADVARVVKKVAKAADLNPAGFSGHSLRAGFVTAAATHGAPLARIQDISRHASLDVLVGYIRRINAFEDHPAEAFA